MTNWIAALHLDPPALTHWLIAAVLLLLGWIVIKAILKVVERALRKSPLDAALYKFISNSIAAVLWVLLIGSLLSWVGVPVSTFVAVVGVVGAAVALALKDSLANVAGGIIILFAKPFKNGDRIHVQNVTGNVDQIDLLYTTLRTPEGEVILVPNGLIGTSVITNAGQDDGAQSGQEQRDHEQSGHEQGGAGQGGGEPSGAAQDDR